jgi:uncharacterized protein YjiS (DUF1127 family)
MSLATTLPATDRTEPRRRTSGLLEKLRLWRRRARERTELSRFTERELHDIGISPTDALREINKPVWRA